ncbi:unnamed protein product [Peronospora destructor]|uniref:SBP-type domain-containing protein n=2 Tax=Peronospora destructor TaxID=86335 RepID=A0AAV0TTG8_9STRA|nr:unnamed protein product [Peronospora destructor]
MDHLLNDVSPDDAADEVVVKNELVNVNESLVVASQTLPYLTTQLANAVVCPDSSAASLGLQMLSVSAAAPSVSMSLPKPPPRLPPISLLTAAAAALQPMQCHPLETPAPSQRHQLCPMRTPLQATVDSFSVHSSFTECPQAEDMLCRYRNKKCGYPRAIKRNGERHNLCERHRSKANQNQRKLEGKRRVKKRMMQRVAIRVVNAKKVVESPENDIDLTLYGDTFA